MFLVSELTVGQVSAIVAAGVAFVKLCLPNLLTFLLVGMLRERNGVVTINAVSWSVIGRLLHSSNWPTLLRGDSAATNGLTLSAKIFKYAGLSATLLISIVAIVTPLGLYEVVVPNENPISENFHYIADGGIFGLGTPTRNVSMPWSRVCDPGNVTTCPSLIQSSSATNDSVDLNVSQKVVELFSNGTFAFDDSVASVFDIQWRSWTWVILDKNSTASAQPNATVYPVGAFRQVATVALDNKLRAIEGLVVDTVKGGVGFRNHSAPPKTRYGSIWTEDVLFIQPVTQCVDTNLTIEYTTPLNAMYDTRWQMKDPRLVDNGGFSMLNLTFPRWNESETQTNPDFWTRAYQAAWLNNVYAMKLLNVSSIQQHNDSNSPVVFGHINSTLGKEFPLLQSDCLEWKPPYISANRFGCFAPKDYTHSFNLTPEVDSDNISLDISLLCEGGWSDIGGNMENIAAYCSLVFGSSQRIDGGDEMSPLPGSKWSTPMYSCMSGVEALIKTVKFAFNATDDLSGLSILDITDKTYPNETAKPLWGVENLDIGQEVMPPLWGLVSPEAVATVQTGKLQTLRKESLFLPGFGSVAGAAPSTDSQNLPGVQFFLSGLSVAHSVGPLENMQSIDYSGITSLAMSRRWTDLSRSAGSISTILNLIWTDYAANAVVGTKGLAATQQGHSAGAKLDDPETGAGVTLPVTVYNRRVKYHLPYAVPAFVVLLFLLLSLLLSLGALLFGQTSLAKLRRYLNATSTGRLLTSTLESPPGVVDNDGPSNTWTETSGKVMFSTGRDKPLLAGWE